MEINKAKMVGYRVIGIKDADKEKLANHVTSSFSVEQEVKSVPETIMSASEVVSEQAQVVEPVETPVVEPAPVETPVDEATSAVEEEVQASVQEENIFDRMAKESIVDPSVSVTPVVEPTSVGVPTASIEPVMQSENVFDNTAVVTPAVPEVPDVAQNEESFDTPVVNLTSPAEFYDNINNNVKEEVIVPVNVENNVVEEKKISANLGADALTALKALIEENECLKGKIADLTEKLNIAEARTKAAETTLNAAIQRDAKTLN